MSSTEFDTRMKRVESRLDKAESLLDSAGRALRTVERAHDTAERGSRVLRVLFAASAIVAVTVVFALRRQQSDKQSK
jgi:hypothetical protein